MTIVLENLDQLNFCSITGLPIEDVEFRVIVMADGRCMVQLGDCNKRSEVE